MGIHRRGRELGSTDTCRRKFRYIERCVRKFDKQGRSVDTERDVDKSLDRPIYI